MQAKVMMQTVLLHEKKVGRTLDEKKVEYCTKKR